MKYGLAGKVKRDRGHEVGKEHVQMKIFRRRKVHTQSTTYEYVDTHICIHLIVKKSIVKKYIIVKKYTRI